MRWLPTISFSPSHSPSTSIKSSPSSSSPAVDIDYSNRKSGNATRSGGRGWRFGYGKRLTRQRKPRHLTDQDIKSLPRWQDSATEDDVIMPLSRSPSTFDRYSVRSFLASPSSVVPQPLPLPELSSSPFLRRKDGDLPLPSPKEGARPSNPSCTSRGVEERDRADVSNGISSNVPIYSVLASQDRRKHTETKSSRRVHQYLSGFESSPDTFFINVPSSSAPTSPFSSPTVSPQRKSAGEFLPHHYSVFASKDRKRHTEHVKTKSYRRVHHDLSDFESPLDTFSINVPTRSVPTSPFSSPTVSPPRTSAGDLLPYYHMTPKGNQDWSAPEMPLSEMMAGLPLPAFFDITAFSTDSSPLHSPQGRSPQRNPRSPSGPSSPIHPKLSLDNPTAKRESNAPVSVHPLPLPPGAALPSPTPPISQVTSKLETLSMKCQWQKGKLIGRGTFGSVYVATNRETGALCAMKEVELLPDDPKSAECIKQLEQEIKVLSHLKHPNIVQYYGSEIVEDSFYIYLEYVHPGSINKYVREHCGAITESVVRSFTRHILSGLAYLHSKKTIHRDIKGANLLVDSAGVVKLADFGMAKHLTGQVADLSLRGSPYWMAPELMLAVMKKDNSSDLAFAVDIWSLGCTIIEMFTGKPPWSEYEGAAAMFKVMRDKPPIPETLSSDGKDFLRCCFKRNPAERPTAQKLLGHRFLKNPQPLDVPLSTQPLNGMTLMDKLQSPIDRYENKPARLLMRGLHFTKGKVAAESETGLQFHDETSDLTVALLYSPRSTLEARLSSSSPGSVLNRHDPIPSRTIPSSVNLGNKKTFIF
ncbi:Protein kinase [Quillaja saponaria]|uniref:mitogen-activated protein kinase kinase kinase n=1 Tax=Quillaja saponaria TaxID=32244 RepID=A0AAD7L905_QUISA|nr:Protein kinase [Quillaja saponaria]